MSCDKNPQTLTARRILCGKVLRRSRERCALCDDRNRTQACRAHVSHPAGRLSFGYAGLNARKDRFGPEKYIYINDIKNHHECPRMCVCVRTGGYTRSRKEKENESNYGRGPDAMCGAAVFDEMERKYWPAIRELTVSLILVRFLFLVLPPPLPRETRPYEFGYVRFTCQKLINPPPPPPPL